MTREEYFATPGLSCSGMKDLAVSPLRYWFWNINPNRPEREPSPEMRFGTALHCAVLEPEKFAAGYAQEITAEDFAEGCLVTISDIRTWLESKGNTPKGTRKADLIAQAVAVDPCVPILEVEEAKHAEQTAGMIVMKKADYARVVRCADALRNEPAVAELLEREGQAEVPMFAKDAETGVMMKGCMDWVLPDMTLDLKTFGQKLSRSLDETVADAIYYQRYHHQAWWYTAIRRYRSGSSTSPSFVLAFVESEEPHEVRVKVLRSVTAGQPNQYWMRAQIECQHMLRLYAHCKQVFAESEPWRTPIMKPDPLIDEEIKQLGYA